MGGDARKRDQPTPDPPVQNSLLGEGHTAMAKAVKEEESGLSDVLGKMRTAQPCSVERAGKRGGGGDDNSVW